MTVRIPIVLLALGGLGGPVAAQELPVSAEACFDVQLAAGPGGHATLRGVLAGAEGVAFLWTASAGVASGAAPWHPVATAALSEAGAGEAERAVPSAVVDQLPALAFRAVFATPEGLVQSPPATLGAPDEDPLGDPLDFDWGLGGVALAAGTVVSRTQPWGEFLALSAVNADPEHPAELVLFDSSHAGAVDRDLATPGTGAGNFEPLGMLLVIAADVTDADGDGLVDVPDAEDAGGTLVLDFAGASTVFGLRLVDVDEGDAAVRWYRDGELLYDETVPAGDDNGAWETGGQFGVTRVEIDLAGSAGLGGLTVYPCETAIDFDHLSTGIPVDAPAGAPLSEGLGAGGGADELLQNLLVYFRAENGTPGHPDLAVLFDTSHPTGADFDLATPGYGPGNDAPLGNVLVLAEDAVDTDGDGLVDDPDDEEAGGVVTLGWYTSSGRFRGATLVDIDANEPCWIEVHLDAGGVQVVPVASPGDNSVQTVTADVGPTRHVEFHLAGSAGIAEIRICPEY